MSQQTADNIKKNKSDITPRRRIGRRIQIPPRRSDKRSIPGRTTNIRRKSRTRVAGKKRPVAGRHRVAFHRTPANQQGKKHSPVHNPHTQRRQRKNPRRNKPVCRKNRTKSPSIAATARCRRRNKNRLHPRRTL